MPEHKPARLRRMTAFLVDLYGSVTLAFIVAFLGVLLFPALEIYVAMFCAIFAIGYLYCRDWLLSGRSIGKRLCGLSVVDLGTNLPAAGKQLLLKNLCYFILPFDALGLVLTGRSIGERISRTAVIVEKIPAPIEKKRFVRLAAVAAVLGLVFGFAASIGMNQAKKNESYALAHDYLIQSETFASQERENTRITLTGFSSIKSDTGHTHEYTFDIRFHSYVVTCHLQEDGTWAVCTECTDFD